MSLPSQIRHPAGPIFLIQTSGRREEQSTHCIWLWERGKVHTVYGGGGLPESWQGATYCMVFSTVSQLPILTFLIPLMAWYDTSKRNPSWGSGPNTRPSDPRLPHDHVKNPRPTFTDVVTVAKSCENTFARARAWVGVYVRVRLQAT